MQLSDIIAANHRSRIFDYVRVHLKQNSSLSQHYEMTDKASRRIQIICESWYEKIKDESLNRPEKFSTTLTRTENSSLEADITINKFILTDKDGINLLTSVFTSVYGIVATPVLRNTYYVFLEPFKDTLLNSTISKSIYNVAFSWTPRNSHLSYSEVPTNPILSRYNTEISIYLKTKVTSLVASEDFISIVSQRIESICLKWHAFVKEKARLGNTWAIVEENKQNLDPTSSEKMKRVLLIDKEGITLIAKIFSEFYGIKAEPFRTIPKKSIARDALQQHDHSLLSLIKPCDIFAVTLIWEINNPSLR